MGMDHGVWITRGPGVCIGTLHFELQPSINNTHVDDSCDY